MLLGHFFSNEVYTNLKSNQRPKFLNVGFNLTSLFLQTTAHHLPSLMELLEPSFTRLLVKNCQNAKSPLHNESKQVHKALLALVQKAAASDKIDGPAAI